MFLTKEQIFAAKDLKRETVEIPEWSVEGNPGAIIVQELTLRERDTLDEGAKDEHGELIPNEFVRLIIELSCVQENGDKFFAPGDYEQLKDKSLGAIQRILDAAKRVSALGEEALEDARKNLSEGQGEDSNSG